MIRMRLNAMVLLLLMLCLTGCARGPGTPPPRGTPDPTPQPQAATSRPAAAAAAVTATPLPTETPAPTAMPTAMPTATASPVPTATPTATPGVALGGCAQCGLVLRPAARQALEPAAAVLDGMTTYSLTVTLAPDLSRLSGTAHITYTNRTTVTLDALYLHLFPNLWNGGMTVGAVEAAGRTVTPTLEAGASLLKVQLPTVLRPGKGISLTIAYACPILPGEGAGNYGELAFDQGVLGLAHSYPSVVLYDTAWRLEAPARQGDVTYHDAALYDVALTGPADLVVAATGAMVSTTPNGDGSTTWRLAGGPMRDFNVIASPNYRLFRGIAGDITVNSYFLPGEEIGGQKVLSWAMAALREFESAFGAYPYRELNLAAMPTKANGIEYPGLVAIGSRLYRSPIEEALFESVTVHEVAHQWWYNVVGNDQINHPWLDEALAQYSTYVYTRDLYGEADAQELVEVVTNLRWGSVGFLEKPIGLPAAAYPGVEYSAIVYGRGPLFFLALRDRLGEGVMAEFLRRYYAGFTWGSATPEGFRKLAEQVSGQDLGDLFAKWVD